MFMFNQIKDYVNLRQTQSLIISLSRFDPHTAVEVSRDVTRSRIASRNKARASISHAVPESVSKFVIDDVCM